MIGRWLVVAGCTTTIVVSLIGLGMNAAVRDRYGYYGDSDVFEFLGLIFPITTMVLALVPSTTAWILAKPNPAAGQYYPPFAG